MISVQLHNRTESQPAEFTQLISDQPLRPKSRSVNSLPLSVRIVRMRIGQARSRSRRKRRAFAAVLLLKIRMKTRAGWRGQWPRTGSAVRFHRPSGAGISRRHGCIRARSSLRLTHRINRFTLEPLKALRLGCGALAWRALRLPTHSPLCLNHVWMAPAGQGLCSGLACGRSRPCIRRLSCSTMAARPDEVRRRSGPSQWRALEGAPVRTGCPEACVAVRLPSPQVVPEARLRRDAPHRLVAGRERPACPVRPGWPGSSHRSGVSRRVAMRSRPVANARTVRAMRLRAARSASLSDGSRSMPHCSSRSIIALASASAPRPCRA